MPVRALDVALGTVWAMKPEELQTLLSIAARENGSWVPDAEPRALAVEAGEKLAGTKGVYLRDGVAVVPVVGPLFRRANMFTQMSGATSLEILARDLRAAVAAPEVKAVLLEFDSPGGEANGVAELAGMMERLRKKKPLHAYVGGIAASGAYWLATAAESITLSKTAMVGSIGAVLAFRRGADDEVELVSSQSPHKRPDFSTEEGRASVQRVLDDLAAEFIADVARNRGVPEKTVVSDFGGGGILLGKHAIRAGMADRAGTFEGVLRKLASGTMPGRAIAVVAELSEEDEVSVSSETEAAPETVAATGAADRDAAGTGGNMDQLEQLNADLAAANSRAAEAEAQVTTLEGRLRDAESRAAEAGVLAEIGQKALAAAKDSYLDLCTRLGRNGAEAAEVATLLVEGKRYDRLQELCAGCREELQKRFRFSGDTSLSSRQLPEEDDPNAVVAEADVPHIRDLAKRFSISEDEAKAKYLENKRRRLAPAAR